MLNKMYHNLLNILYYKNNYFKISLPAYQFIE